MEITLRKKLTCLFLEISEVLLIELLDKIRFHHTSSWLVRSDHCFLHYLSGRIVQSRFYFFVISVVDCKNTSE